VPIFTYFHENQFAYPVQIEHERDLHFAVTNLTTASCSDRVAFNSVYNMESFFKGCIEMERKIPDMKLNVTGELRQKSIVLHPGVDFSQLDETPAATDVEDRSPVIIWNHRWEYDKNPDLFFRTLFQLDDLQVDYKLVLGQSFEQHPEIFDKTRKRLGHRLLHVGYVAEREKYYQWLRQGTLVVSTANHEFYGIAVIEAVRAGCRPLLPNRLSYPELFPADYLYYNDEDLLYRLRDSLKAKRLDNVTAQKLTGQFSWSALAGSYTDWLNS